MVTGTGAGLFTGSVRFMGSVRSAFVVWVGWTELPEVLCGHERTDCAYVIADGALLVEACVGGMVLICPVCFCFLISHAVVIALFLKPKSDLYWCHAVHIG